MIYQSFIAKGAFVSTLQSCVGSALEDCPCFVLFFAIKMWWKVHAMHQFKQEAVNTGRDTVYYLGVGYFKYSPVLP